MVHVEVGLCGEHPFCLLDENAGVQGAIELFVQVLGADRSAVLEDPDSGDIGKRLRRDAVSNSHLARLGPEQVQRADDRTPQAHLNGVC